MAASTTAYALPDHFHLDIKWWSAFMRSWNGKSLLPIVEWSEDSPNCVELHTDACTAGYGAVHGPEWFAGTWTATEEQDAMRGERDSMPWKELHVIVRAAATWGKHWAGKLVRLRSYCQPSVSAWSKGDSPSPAIASLLRTLLYLTAVHGFTLTIVHIPGVDNVLADLLSRGQILEFLALSEKHFRSPTIPLPFPIHGW
jgi:hypothetical protein